MAALDRVFGRVYRGFADLAAGHGGGSARIAFRRAGRSLLICKRFGNAGHARTALLSYGINLCFRRHSLRRCDCVAIHGPFHAPAGRELVFICRRRSDRMLCIFHADFSHAHRRCLSGFAISLFPPYFCACFGDGISWRTT